MDISLEEIAQLTEQYGGAWGINHTRRLTALIDTIEDGREYDREALELAVLLHDWGAYPVWAKEGMEHDVRSVEVAGQFLAEHGCEEQVEDLVLTCIASHHSQSADLPYEAILLRDADVLDFLGTVGVLRDFSKNPRNMRKAREVVDKRMQSLPGCLVLSKAKELAVQRMREMEELLNRFERDSFGYY